MRTLSVLFAFAAALAGCQSVNDMMKAAPRPTARIVGTSLQGLTLEHVDLVYSVSGLLETETRFGAIELPFDRKGDTRIAR